MAKFFKQPLFEYAGYFLIALMVIGLATLELLSLKNGNGIFYSPIFIAFFAIGLYLGTLVMNNALDVGFSELDQINEKKDDNESPLSIENARLLLPIFYQRMNELANIIHVSNGFILVFLGAVLAYNGGLTDKTNTSLTISVCVGAIIMWRIYAHYVDNDIISTYGKIIECEKSLGIHGDMSLKNQIFKGFPNDDRIKIYIRERNVGYRGHFGLDVLAIFLSECLIFWKLHGNFNIGIEECILLGIE
jgi:hypothetical protein